jgi:hypothetical protein
MFHTKKEPVKKSLIDLEIERLLAVMAKIPPGSERYSKILHNLDILQKTKGSVNTTPPAQSSFAVDPNTVIVAITNIVGILMVINHEQLGVISSKAFGLIMKGRA